LEIARRPHKYLVKRLPRRHIPQGIDVGNQYPATRNHHPLAEATIHIFKKNDFERPIIHRTRNLFFERLPILQRALVLYFKLAGYNNPLNGSHPMVASGETSVFWARHSTFELVGQVIKQIRLSCKKVRINDEQGNFLATQLFS